MKIVFHEDFYNSDYADNSAAAPGRIEAAMESIKKNNIPIVAPSPAFEKDVLRIHDPEYIQTLKKDEKLYKMALLSAGGAVRASEIALSGEAAFACIRPPGHHAYRNMAWGFCYMNNIGTALSKLRNEKRIESAFVLDFDAHKGDGTIDVLSDWPEALTLNPMADNNIKYLSLIEDYIKGIDYVDIVAVSAGFDSYEKDVGRKLTTFDFYKIGYLMKKLAKRFGHNRRFAVLEGGYYYPDLGKNVLSFCQGFD